MRRYCFLCLFWETCSPDYRFTVGETRTACAGEVGAFESVVDDIEDAGKSAGAEVENKVPSTSQLGG